MAYDFVNLGLDGVSAYVDYISGNWAVDDHGDSLPEKSETDVNIDYCVKQGSLLGFWLRLCTAQDSRIKFNSVFPVF